MRMGKDCGAWEGLRAPQGQLRSCSRSGARPGGGGGARSCGEENRHGALRPHEEGGPIALNPSRITVPQHRGFFWPSSGLWDRFWGQSISVKGHIPDGCGWLPGPESSARCPYPPACRLDPRKAQTGSVSPQGRPPGTHLPAVIQGRNPGWHWVRGQEGRRVVGMAREVPADTGTHSAVGGQSTEAPSHHHHHH